jgi:hypothetical protein
MALKPLTIELHIEELVLHGFARRDRLAIADALQEELSRVIAEDGLAEIRGPASIERVKAGSFHVAAEAGGKAIGTQAANAVYQGVRALGSNGQAGRPAPR